MCVCVCARASHPSPEGWHCGQSFFPSALCLTPDLSERYSGRVLNMSRPLTDRWGQKKRVGLRKSLTEIYEWKRRDWKDVLDIGGRDSLEEVVVAILLNTFWKVRVPLRVCILVWMFFLITYQSFADIYFLLLNKVINSESENIKLSCAYQL